MDSQHYQNARKTLVEKIDQLRTLRDELKSREPGFIKEIPLEVSRKMEWLDRESSRLRQADLSVAFVGGFSAGKSSLVNAFLGRYLLPESTKITTAVPTFVKTLSPTDSTQEYAELHYLSGDEFRELGDLYREEVVRLTRLPELKNLPFPELMERIKPLAREGRLNQLVKQFQSYHDRRHDGESRGKIIRVSIKEAQDKICDENEAIVLDRVVLRIRHDQIPSDTVLVDLPGVSVPNPRHRDITFRFIREEAHAVVFVLMATRLFDKDEIEIMETFQQGDARVTEKTFWVLNRWDALSQQQKEQTSVDFEQKMREFGISSNYQHFRTNALHGLLAQIRLKKTELAPVSLEKHFADYDKALPAIYNSSHEAALRESNLGELQRQVLSFLNEHLRLTTLRSAYDNTRQNFSDPIVHHLRRLKDQDEDKIERELGREQKETVLKRVDELSRQRREAIGQLLRQMCDEIATKRSAILNRHTEKLVNQLREKITKGSETDAYQIYQHIISTRELRKYPYHFEIEMQIVDGLNTMFKRSFREIVRQQVDEVFRELTERIENALEDVRRDVDYDRKVIEPFEEILRTESKDFANRVDGVVMTLAAKLDELLLYKAKFLGFGGNEILEGLEEAARMGLENLRNSGQIAPEDFTAKTQKIRDTLTSHYISRIRASHESITQDIFPIIINNIQLIKERLQAVMQAKYRPALEEIESLRTSEEFVGKKRGIENRVRRFREIIEEIEESNVAMQEAMGSTTVLLKR